MPAAALVGFESATPGREQTSEFLRVHDVNYSTELLKST
jgi:hypothetical protein